MNSLAQMKIVNFCRVIALMPVSWTATDTIKCEKYCHEDKENIYEPLTKIDFYRGICTTKDAIEWRTAKKTMEFKKTHMSLCVFDSAWEAAHARELDRNPDVAAWIKNDHLGFEIPYIHSGAPCVYIPDFIVKLTNDEYLVLEVKGLKKGKDESKWDFMETWTEAVSQHEENGKWHFAVSQDPTGQRVHQIVGKLVQG